MAFVFRHRLLFLYLLIVTQGGCFLDILCDAIASVPSAALSRMPIEENLGQAEPSARFYARGRGLTGLFLDDGLVIDLNGRGVVRLELAGASRSHAEARQAKLQQIHYLIGRDRSKWIRNVRTFEAVQYRNVYRGIHMVFHGAENDDALEQDFEVAPGADPSQIRMRFSGAADAAVSDDGSLRLQIGKETLRWHAPRVFQKARRSQKEIAARYKRHADGSFGFELGSYDKSKFLTIDPVITYATYAGSGGNDGPGRMVLDPQGNVYIASSTNDPAFPVSAGAFTRSTGINATITKLNAAGTEAVFTTHFGGTTEDWGASVALDRQGNIYLCGATASPDFPVTTGVIGPSVRAGDRMSAFVAKLNPAGNQLLYGTYLAGSLYDAATAIAVDDAGNAYVGGMTTSNNFPATPDSLQPQYRASGNYPGFDGFVVKLNPTATRLLYGTFLGGSGTEYLLGLAIDASGAAYVTGATASANFPVSANAYQKSFGGTGTGVLSVGDGFVSKISPDGSTLVYSTLLGGRGDDQANAIAVDTQGNAYIGGNTLSVNFPVTAGAYQAAYRGAGGDNDYPAGDGFVTKLNATGSALVYSTLLGGTRDDRVWAVGVDATGAVWAAGHTLSRDFPVSADAAQKSYAGERAGEAVTLGDAFVAKLNAAGSALVYGTYHGGAANESAGALALDRDGSVVVSGITGSSNLPVTPGAYQGRPRGGDPFGAPALDRFVLRLGEAPTLSISAIRNEASGDAASIAPGMIAVVDLAAALPDETKTRVLFEDAEGQVLSVSAKQVVVQVPYALAGKASANVIVESNGVRSPAVAVLVTKVAPGVYAATVANEDGTLNDAEHPAIAGTLVSFRITGDGERDADGAPVEGVIVAVGDGGVEVVSARAIAEEPGRTLVTIRLPAELSAGEYPLVVIQADKQSQQGVKVFVSSPAAVVPF